MSRTWPGRLRPPTRGFGFLALIATIALPLIVISGFFGQNFNWMVDHVGSWQAFVGLGISLQVLALLALVTYFKRRGWF